MLLLSAMLKTSYSGVLMAIRFAEEEEFDELHDKVMGKFRGPLLEFNETTRSCIDAAVKTSLDGGMDAEEERSLKQKAEELRVANQTLAASFEKMRDEVCSSSRLARMSE